MGGEGDQVGGGGRSGGRGREIRWEGEGDQEGDREGGGRSGGRGREIGKEEEGDELLG